MEALIPLPEDNVNKVAFMFYNNFAPFTMVQKLSYDRKHYSGVMTLVDRRDSWRQQKDDHFIVVFFT